MADKQGGGRRRRRPNKKSGDNDVNMTTGGQKNQGKKNQPAKKQPQQQRAKGGKQQAKQQPKGKQQGGKKSQGKQKQTKPQKQARNQKNKQNANKAKKPTKQSRAKVSEDRERQKRKREDKQRLDLIIRSKFQNPTKKAPSQRESQICEHLVNLEASNKDFRNDLRALGIVAAREIQVVAGKRAIVIFVPFAQKTSWQKIQDRVTRELEKKFSGQDVIFVAQRKVMHLNQIKNNYPRPRNQTITSVHEQILDDVVYPTRIVGKRTRFRVGGKRLLKVYLDPKDSKDIEPKLATFEAVYKKLTKKQVKFMFPRYTI